MIIKNRGFYLILGLFFFISLSCDGQIWLGKNTNVKIFSTSPLEDIEAISSTGTIAFNEKSGKIFVKVLIKSFKFQRGLMQEHFNENYMESDTYPTAEFDGVIQNLPDLSLENTHKIQMKGTLTIHGVKKEVDLPATIIITKDKIEGKANFKIKCIDYNIEIPKLVIKNIAEEIDITILTEFKPYKK